MSVDAFDRLRRLALDAAGQVAGRPELPDVRGVVVDLPGEGGYATIVALADGTTSMYTSGGGGMIGLGAIPAIVESARRLLVAVQEHLGAFTAGDDGALPPSDVVRFHALGVEGAWSVDVADDRFWSEADHPLEGVTDALHALIDAMQDAEGDR